MECEFKCLGAPISRQNMANWAMRAWELWLSRLRARMKELLLAGDIVHADETEVQVLREPGREAVRKSRMWLFAAPACARPIYVYEYNPTRSGKVAEDFLRGWSGWLRTDGYRPYFALENGGKVANVACLVHIRRRFAEIAKSAGGDAKAEAAASVALDARRRIDSQGRRPEPAQVPGMAADRDAQRRRPRRPGLPGLPDAVVGFRAGWDQADAGRGRGRQDGRRPHHRHRPVGLLRRREIGSLSEFSQNEMGKL